MFKKKHIVFVTKKSDADYNNPGINFHDLNQQSCDETVERVVKKVQKATRFRRFCKFLWRCFCFCFVWIVIYVVLISIPGIGGVVKTAVETFFWNFGSSIWTHLIAIWQWFISLFK